MKKYAIEFDSELFGYLQVEMTEEEAASQDAWYDLNDLIAVNVFVHPDDEDLAFDSGADKARWLVSIWACKKFKGEEQTSFNEEIEHIFLTDIKELQ